MHLVALLLKAGDNFYLLGCICGPKFMEKIFRLLNFSDFYHIIHSLVLFQQGFLIDSILINCYVL
jgi:hypothetical protein